MSYRSKLPDHLILKCIEHLVVDPLTYINSRDVAEFIKCHMTKYKRIKTSVLVRMIEPSFERNYDLVLSHISTKNNTYNNAASKSEAQSHENVTNQTSLIHGMTGEAIFESHKRNMRTSSLSKKKDYHDLDKSESGVSMRHSNSGVLKRRVNSISNSNLKRYRSNPPSEDVESKSVLHCLQPVQNLPLETLYDLGGIDQTVQHIKELVIQPLQNAHIYSRLGAAPVTGIILYGPPGSGKTHLALATANEAKVPFFHVTGPELIAGISGETEDLIRKLFENAIACSPSLIFIDEIDTLCSRRDAANSRDMERRIVAQLGLCIDSLANHFVIVIGATSSIEQVDSTMRRNGRFDREIVMGVPDDSGRKKILGVTSKSFRVSPEVNFNLIAKKTPGFLGADLRALMKEAVLICVKDIFDSSSQIKTINEEALQQLCIQECHILEAIKSVQPSAQREGFASIPNITWDDVGGLAEQRAELIEQICNPIEDFALYQSLGLHVPAGILLYGPPGCGKTLLAKTVATESGANFISVNGPELLSKYVGESERAIRLIFQRARLSAPCIIFFDELDSLCVCRGSSGTNNVSERVTNQLLTEMDGVQERKNVYVIAATNRPELIDPAMLRPGRLGKLIRIPLPNESARLDILQRLCRNMACNTELIDFQMIAKLTERFSGADLHALLRQSVLIALREYRLKKCNLKYSQNESLESFETDCTMHSQQSSEIKAEMHHILRALEIIHPSVTAEHLEHYNKIQEQISLNALP